MSKYTVNSNGRRTQSFRTPIKGLYYSKSTSGQSYTKRTIRPPKNQPIQYSSKTYYVCGKILQVISVIMILIGTISFLVGGFIFVILGLIFWKIGKSYINKYKND